MAEYIDREAIFKAYMDLCYAKSRLAKANGGGAGALVGDNLYPEVEPTMKEVFRMIMAMPAADVVKVVKEKPQTKADRIRAMSDEELADFLAGIIIKESLLRLKDEGCLLTEIREKALRHQLFLTVAQFLKEPVKDGDNG